MNDRPKVGDAVILIGSQGFKIIGRMREINEEDSRTPVYVIVSRGVFYSQEDEREQHRGGVP